MSFVLILYFLALPVEATMITESKGNSITAAKITVVLLWPIINFAMIFIFVLDKVGVFKSD